MKIHSLPRAQGRILSRLLGTAVLAATLQGIVPADDEFCVAPRPKPQPAEKLAGSIPLQINEVEPNNTLSAAHCIPLGAGIGARHTLDIVSTFGVVGDEDFIKFSARRGEVLSVAAVSDQPAMPVNTVLTLADAAGLIHQSADFHAQALTLFPPETRVRQVITPDDAILLWVIPADGDYVVRVQEAFGGTGPYTLRLFLGPSGLEKAPYLKKQILFLDFDGALINAQQIFGFGNSFASLSPLASFLGNWGLAPALEDAVIDAILTQVAADLNSVSALNPRFAFELRNSRDHVDSFGSDPFVSRVIVGGTAAQLGITTNGIAQWFDLGNYSTNDTAVVLLDRLSAPAGGPDSINSVPRAAGVTIIEAIGTFVGRVISHEIGHYVGHFHTDPTNGIPAIMDRANIPANLVGVGPDGIFGSADDSSAGFAADFYDPFPGFLQGIQPVDLQTAIGLSSRRRASQVRQTLTSLPSIRNFP